MHSSFCHHFRLVYLFFKPFGNIEFSKFIFSKQQLEQSHKALCRLFFRSHANFPYVKKAEKNFSVLHNQYIFLGFTSLILGSSGLRPSIKC